MQLASSGLPNTWIEVLESIEKALAQTEADAARAAEASASPTPADPQSEGPSPLDRLDERLRRLRASAAQAEQTAAQAGAAVEDGEQALRRWLAEAAALRGKLAKPDEAPLS
jgi:hypothetical protein